MRAMNRIPPMLLTLALLLAPALAEARGSGRIMGSIQDRSGKALLGAVVTVFKEDRNGGTISFTRTDNRGGYSLAQVAPGSYQLQVSHEGYRSHVSSNIVVAAGRTVTLNVILQEFVDLISAEDPRNWDFRSVLRSAADRRLIFRALDETAPTFREWNREFMRGGTLSVATTADLGSSNFTVLPGSAHTGIVSNFAYAEPLTESSRMIVSGQLHSGYDTLWRIRNTLDYRPEPGRQMRFHLGYGRMNLNGTSISALTRPQTFFAQDPSLRESGVQTLALGFSASSEFLDALDLEYGFDLSRIYYGTTKSVFSPFLLVSVSPAEGWTLRTAMTSRRFTDSNSVALPDGEVINLMEPTYIAKIHGEIHLTQFKHAELAVARELADDMSVELAVYQDRTEGPGTPLLVTLGKKAARNRYSVAQLREGQLRHQGLRFVVNRKFLDSLSGSAAYVYGTGSGLADRAELLPGDLLARNLLNYIHRSYHHSFTGQFSASIARTQTNLDTFMRWHAGDTLTTIDLFSDRVDMMNKGVSFTIRQMIPLPEFMGTAGRWEALVDVRNLLDQGRYVVQTSDGHIILTRNPRSLRFGLNLNFY